MNIIYASNSYRYIQLMERELIAFLPQSRTKGIYYNSNPGGEGRKSDDCPYYLYVVCAPIYSRLY